MRESESDLMSSDDLTMADSWLDISVLHIVGFFEEVQTELPTVQVCKSIKTNRFFNQPAKIDRGV